MAISTVIIIVISIAVLIGLLILVKNGFLSFEKGINPILKSSSTGAVREACNIACTASDSNTFCCSNFTIGDREVLCTDKTLGISCDLDCNARVCA